MSPSRPKKALPPEDLRAAERATAEGLSEELGKRIPSDGNGLGPVGEGALIGLLDEADRDEEQHRTLMKFTPRWRVFIRRQDDTRLDAADEVIDDHLGRKAMRRFWIRMWRLGLLVGGGGIAWGSGFFERVLPLVRQFLKLIQGAS